MGAGARRRSPRHRHPQPPPCTTAGSSPSTAPVTGLKNRGLAAIERDRGDAAWSEYRTAPFHPWLGPCPRHPKRRRRAGVAQHRRCLQALVSNPKTRAQVCPGRRTVRVHHGRQGTGSPTAPETNTPPSTHSWRQDTACVRSSGRPRACLAHRQQVPPTPRSQRTCSSVSGKNAASVLDDYKPYLDDRWNKGFTNAWKLWEIPTRPRLPAQEEHHRDR